MARDTDTPGAHPSRRRRERERERESKTTSLPACRAAHGAAGAALRGPARPCAARARAGSPPRPMLQAIRSGDDQRCARTQDLDHKSSKLRGERFDRDSPRTQLERLKR